MPGLVRGIARTAVIAGTASATANAVNRRQADKNVAAYANAAQQVSAQQAPPVQAMPGGSMDDKLAQLERLGQLKAQGILSEEEFAQQKAAILG
jgi:Short C-terminal domain